MATLSALPVHPRSWAALLERDDIVLDQGVLRLRHDRTTPDDARTEDLLLTATRPRSGRRERAAGASRRAHSRPRRGCGGCRGRGRRAARAARTAVRQAQGARSDPAPPSSTTLLPPPPPSACIVRGSPSSGELRYNHEIGIRVEFWRFGDELVEAPHENALMRRTHAGIRASTSPTSTRYGRRWRTLEHMFACTRAEFDRDVDMVFSWVDGSSDDSLRERARAMAELRRRRGRRLRARYRQIDELQVRPAQRAPVRAVGAPHLHRHRLAGARVARAIIRKVTIVRSEEIFADTSVLPTHNSHAVESAAAPHRRARRALPLLERRHVLRSPGRARRCSSRPAASRSSSRRRPASALGELAARPQRPRQRRPREPRPAARALRQGHDTRHLEHCAAPLRRSVMARPGARRSPRTSPAPRRAGSARPPTSR